MFKIRFNNNFILSITLILLLALLFLVINTYQVTLTKSKLSHQKNQLEMAKSTASGIQIYLKRLVRDVSLLNHKTLKINGHDIIIEQEINALFTLDENQKLRISDRAVLPSNFAALTQNLDAKFSSNSNSKTKRVWISEVFPSGTEKNTDDLIFLIVIREKSNASSGSDIYLGAVINFNWLIKNFISPLRLTEHDFAWILDSSGRLIYHPNHSEMLMRQISSEKEECQACHKSFDVQKKMLAGKQGLDEYFVEGESSKIMAYVPIKVFDMEWILAISTYSSFVVTDVVSSYLIVFIIAGLILVLVVTMGYLAYKLNIKRIQAEESEKHLEQVQNYQEKLNQASKMASIGELVDSVAHEINTPVGIISALSDTIMMESDLESECITDIKRIKKQTMRITDYTRSLLSFSRRMPFDPQKNSLPALINECIFLVGPRLKSNNVKIEKNIPADFPEFIFDKGRIEQVIINLLNNAIDFAGDEKLIRIECNNINKAKNEISGECAEILVSDYGPGIKEENIKSIFEPFFSTKPLQKGTGLGLSISKAIIERHDGEIEVNSIEQEGTTFRIILPLRQN